MIKEFNLINFEFDEGSEFDRQFFTPNFTGKILKIFVQGINENKVIVSSNQNETILEIEEDGTYYPRCNVGKQKKANEMFQEGDQLDYYYISGGLNIWITRPSKENKPVEKILIVYEE